MQLMKQALYLQATIQRNESMKNNIKIMYRQSSVKMTLSNFTPSLSQLQNVNLSINIIIFLCKI